MYNKIVCVLAILALWSNPTNANTECETVAAAAVAGGLTGLTSALDVAGLADTFNIPGDTTAYTVFAPNNDAFTAALTAIGSNGTLTQDQIDQFKQILQAHVVMGSYDAAALTEQMPMLPTLLEGVNLTSDGSTVSVGNSTANIVQPDAVTDLCGGSVVHIIDAVLVPVAVDASPAPPVDSGNCTTIAAAAVDANLTTLVTLLTEADLADSFSDTESDTAYTVFAPDNEAFQAVLQALGGGSPTSDQLDMISTVLKAHVVEGVYDAANLTAGGGVDMQTLDENSQLNSNGMTVTLGNSSATIIAADAATGLCGGSVVHVIDAVLVPSEGADDIDTDMMYPPQPPLPPGASPRPSPPGVSPSPSNSSATGLVEKATVLCAAVFALLLIFP